MMGCYKYKNPARLASVQEQKIIRSYTTYIIQI